MKVPESFTFRGIKLVSVRVSSKISDDTCKGCYFDNLAVGDCTGILEPTGFNAVPMCSEYSKNFENNRKDYIFVPEESA